MKMVMMKLLLWLCVNFLFKYKNKTKHFNYRSLIFKFKSTQGEVYNSIFTSSPKLGSFLNRQKSTFHDKKKPNRKLNLNTFPWYLFIIFYKNRHQYKKNFIETLTKLKT